MSSAVLDCFPKILNNNPKQRANGGAHLLKHLSLNNLNNEENKEFNHILTRLVRGLGSSKDSSRKGFYSTLTVLLSENSDIKVETIIKFVDKELKPSKSNENSENGSIHCGRILACGALIRSKILKNSTTAEQSQVLKDLINSGKQRSFLHYACISFLLEFINQFQTANEILPLWSIFEEEICVPLSEQTLDKFYAFLMIQNKFPDLVTKKIKKKCFGDERIINDESIPDIINLLSSIPRQVYKNHPVYEVFSQFLVTTEFLEQFWLTIDQKFMKPTKSEEFVGVKMFELILKNIQNKSFIVTLLSKNFLKYILRELKRLLRQKNDCAKIFKNSLALIPKILDKEADSKIKLEVIKKLIVSPGDLFFEKTTGTKTIQLLMSNLNAEYIKKLSKLYHRIASNSKFKEKEDSIKEPWTNIERGYAVQLLIKLLHHPDLINENDWRIEQLKFLFNLGFCEESNVGLELSSSFAESFYRALDYKLSSLEDLIIVLTSLVNYINDIILLNSDCKLKTNLSEEALDSWKSMMNLLHTLEKKEKSNKTITTVFKILNLHMGLQLFTDSKMASSVIVELHSCVNRLFNVNKKHKDNSMNIDEPEWIEVVVDLLLSLLSRNSHLFRSLVKCVFPHICPHLIPSALHQILAVLDVKNKNPLSIPKSEESDSEIETDENSDDNEETDEDSSEDEEMKNGENIDEESDSDIEESDVEDETVTDRLRLAVSQALGEASMQTDDEDIDIDQIGEEEGKRLDESLAAAFKILKENRKAQSKKQAKNAQALTHFRARVIDLLEMYIDNNPCMALTLDILLPLFSLLEFTIKDPHQKPLQERVCSCLINLSNLKKFSNLDGVDEQILIDVLKALFEKGEKSAAVCYEMGDKLAKCCIFLIKCSQHLNTSTESFDNYIRENLTFFFTKRDCILPPLLFKNILQLPWLGNWLLVDLLVNFAFDNSIRTFKRSQALDFLKIFYNNTKILLSNEHLNIRLKMEKKLFKKCTKLLDELVNPEKTTEKDENDKGNTVNQKYVTQLFALLITVHISHLPEIWDWSKISEAISKYRLETSLSSDTRKEYNKLAVRINAKTDFFKKNKQQPKLANGKVASELKKENIESENDNSELEQEKGEPKKDDLELKNKLSDNDDLEKTKSPQNINEKKKKKKLNKEKQKLKKEAKKLREKVASEGLENINFSSFTNCLNGSIKEEIFDNEDTISETNKPTSKRHSSNLQDLPRKKKKKNIENDV